MKKAIWKSLVVVMTSVFLFSCSKSTTTVVAPLSATTVKDLPADTIIGITPQGQPFGTGKFTFYSLEKNTIIANSDSATTKWDLAFNGTKILTNSGNSGSGLGGAFIQIGLFEELKTISSDSVFKTDNGPSSYGVTFGSGRGWYTYDPIKNLVTPLAGRVLVIRTASGKYAKVEIIAYYKGGATLAATAPDAEKISKQRYYTFRYIFQPNGTRNF
ncbi:MAG: HmuY family protein [Chitinophagaceae bacterium]|jgi:hypothetical protein|nr:HmuY family protein [Sediminibacterium sp.]